jgi:hypothetical protein
MKKIQGLLSASGDDTISQVYKNTLASLFTGVSTESNSLVFDRKALSNNYRFILLGLLDLDKNKEKPGLVLEKLIEELKRAAKERDSAFLKLVLEGLARKEKESPGVFKLSLEEAKKVIENLILEADSGADIVSLFELIDKSYLGAQAYLDKIFSGHQVNPLVLKLFLKFHPQELPRLYFGLQQRASDLEYLTILIRDLSLIDLPIVVEALRQIFSFVNPVLKIEVIKAMQRLSSMDEAFLLSVLSGSDMLLKRQALSVLVKSGKLNPQMLAPLFTVPSLFGLKNNIILENLEAVEEAEAKEAREYLVEISNRRFFWNNNIRNRAKKILQKWGI